MTLEELKNKKVTITVDKTFSLLKDLGEETLQDYIEEQEEMGYSDKKLIEILISDYYSSDFEDLLDINDFKVKIHD